MSTQSVETILSRAMNDSAFADQLIANPEQILAGYDLSAEEAAAFKSISRADVETLATASLEERKSFSLLTHCAGGVHFKKVELHIT